MCILYETIFFFFYFFNMKITHRRKKLEMNEALSGRILKALII